MTTIHEGVRGYVVPDCAKCMYEGEDINSMDRCPLCRCESEYDCDPDCEFYTEDWDRI